MDNASKALIIAGAILIAVMLVSLGVMLYNTAANVAENSVGSVEALGISGYNAQFETYVGNAKSREQAKGLVRKIRANNETDNPEISLSGSGVGSANGTAETDMQAAETALNGARPNQRYDITATYTDGYISAISIALAT